MRRLLQAPAGRASEAICKYKVPQYRLPGATAVRRCTRGRGATDAAAPPLRAAAAADGKAPLVGSGVQQVQVEEEAEIKLQQEQEQQRRRPGRAQRRSRQIAASSAAGPHQEEEALAAALDAVQSMGGPQAAADAEPLAAALWHALHPGDGSSSSSTTTTTTTSSSSAAPVRPKAVVAVSNWSTPGARAAAAAFAAAAAAATPSRCIGVIGLFPNSALLLSGLPLSDATTAAATAAAGAAPAEDGQVQCWLGGAAYGEEGRAARAAPPRLLLATPGRLRQHLEDSNVRWGEALGRVALVVVHGADAFLAPGGNLRPSLDGALAALLQPKRRRSRGASPRATGADGDGAPPPPPQLLLLASPAGAAAAVRFCSTLPQLGGRPVVVDLAGGPPAAGVQAGRVMHLQGGLQQAGGQQQQQQQQQQEEEEEGEQEEAEDEQQEQPSVGGGPPPVSVVVSPQHLMLTQLAVVVRRHLVGRRAAKVVVEFRSAYEAQLCARLFRLLLKLPTLELHSRKTLSYRQSVIAGFAAQRSAVVLATAPLAAALLAQTGEGQAGGGVTLHVKVGLPAGALAALASGGGGGASASAGVVPQGRGGAAKVLLLLDFEATAALGPAAAAAALAPPQAGSAAAALLAAAGGAAGGAAAPAVPLDPRVPPKEAQRRLDALAQALGTASPNAPPTGAAAAAPGPAAAATGAAAAPAAARVRELASLQPSVAAALRRVPQALKERAYIAWLALHLTRATELGWSRREVAAAADSYARSLGCEERPVVPWAVAVRMGVQDLADVRVGPKGSGTDTL